MSITSVKRWLTKLSSKPSLTQAHNLSMGSVLFWLTACSILAGMIVAWSLLITTPVAFIATWASALKFSLFDIIGTGASICTRSSCTKVLYFTCKPGKTRFTLTDTQCVIWTGAMYTAPAYQRAIVRFESTVPSLETVVANAACIRTQSCTSATAIFSTWVRYAWVWHIFTPTVRPSEPGTALALAATGSVCTSSVIATDNFSAVTLKFTGAVHTIITMVARLTPALSFDTYSVSRAHVETVILLCGTGYGIYIYSTSLCGC